MEIGDHEVLHTPWEAAKILGVSRGTLARWRTQGQGPQFLKLGDEPNSPVRYKASDLKQFLEGSVMMWEEEV